MAPVDLGGQPKVRVEATHEFDGLHIERRSWQLPCGPRTEAVFLKPAGAKGRLPAILALHDHGGNKFLGWRKIARIDDKPSAVVDAHQSYYGGGAAEMYRCNFYSGGHKFDLEMQKDAFEWFDRHLKDGK